MAEKLKTTLKAGGRWILWVLAAAGIALLAGSLETGKVNAANTAFTFLGALTHVVTPNGDALNDVALFCFDNPRSSDVSGTVYDLRGNKVAGLNFDSSPANCPGVIPTGGKMSWDAKVAGRAVSGGVYIYQIQSEGTTITGTVLVVR